MYRIYINIHIIIYPTPAIGLKIGVLNRSANKSSNANPAQIKEKRAILAVLISWQIQKGCHDFEFHNYPREKH